MFNDVSHDNLEAVQKGSRRNRRFMTLRTISKYVNNNPDLSFRRVL